MLRAFSLLVPFILLFNIIIFDPIEIVAAGEISESINYEMLKDPDDYEYGGIYFRIKSSYLQSPSLLLLLQEK